MKQVILMFTFCLVCTQSFGADNALQSCAREWTTKLLTTVRDTVGLRTFDQLDAILKMNKKLCVPESEKRAMTIDEVKDIGSATIGAAREVFGRENSLLNAYIQARAPHLAEKSSAPRPDSMLEVTETVVRVAR
jgi:hypothetical protein